MRVSVIGGGGVRPGDHDYETARSVGRLLAERGHTVVCGGLSGVMEAACRGAGDAGGRSVGILPGEDVGAANRYVDVAVATGLGNARNVLVVLNGAAAIAVAGGPGTLSEIGHALDFGRPVAGIRTHAVDGVASVGSAEAAVEHVDGAA